MPKVHLSSFQAIRQPFTLTTLGICNRRRIILIILHVLSKQLPAETNTLFTSLELALLPCSHKYASSILKIISSSILKIIYRFTQSTNY